MAQHLGSPPPGPGPHPCPSRRTQGTEAHPRAQATDWETHCRFRSDTSECRQTAAPVASLPLRGPSLHRNLRRSPGKSPADYTAAFGWELLADSLQAQRVMRREPLAAKYIANLREGVVLVRNLQAAPKTL